MTCSFVSSPDKGGAVLSAVVDYYLESSSSQAILLLSSIRETHHKVSVLSPSFTLALNPFFFFFFLTCLLKTRRPQALLEKLNESLNRPLTRLVALTLLGHLIRKQPPWVHHISRSALLPSLLRCLKVGLKNYVNVCSTMTTLI